MKVTSFHFLIILLVDQRALLPLPLKHLKSVHFYSLSIPSAKLKLLSYSSGQHNGHLTPTSLTSFYFLKILRGFHYGASTLTIFSSWNSSLDPCKISSSLSSHEYIFYLEKGPGQVPNLNCQVPNLKYPQSHCDVHSPERSSLSDCVPWFVCMLVYCLELNLHEGNYASCSWNILNIGPGTE